MKRYGFLPLLPLAALLTLGLLAACTDEPLTDGTAAVPEGREATVTLRWSVEEAVHLTRAAQSDEATSKVKSLWIGVYNAATGERTYSHVFLEEEMKDKVTTDQESTVHEITLENTLSGRSWVVAVANVENNYGIMDGFPEVVFTSDGQSIPNVYGTPADGETDTGMRPRLYLATLLAAADTWEKYKAISSILTENGTVTRSTDNFPMSGCYRTDPAPEDKPHTDPSSWYDAEGNPTEDVTILPGTSSLTGVIHLRRQESYSKFNLIAGEHVTVTPVSWQVVNVPLLSCLSERQGDINIGDTSTGLANRTADYREGNYGHSGTFVQFEKEDNLTNALGETAGKGGGYSFDFYLFENKRTGRESVTTYTDREKEYKHADGTNTGLYQSLVASEADTGDKNNCATYVILSANLSYYVLNDKPVASTTAGALHRTGTATYVIHLGYCEGEDEVAKSRDFHCRRNTKYTYNIIVNGMDNIRVEAINHDQEPQPGMEGDVSDSDLTVFDLDAHYGTFNIALTNSDRRNLSYHIQVPFGDEVYEYDTKNNNGKVSEVFKNDEFWKWIRFRPTISKTALAKYKNSSTDSEPWTLTALADPDAYKPVGTDGKEVSNPNDATEYYYTVFIDEYVYAKNEKGENLDLSKWYEFTDKGMRKIWLMNNDARRYSADGESSYIKAKYLVQQSSIETFYNTDESYSDISLTALGVERTNESYGLNLVVNSADASGKTLKNSNGRYNMWQFVNGKNWDDRFATTTTNSKQYYQNQYVGAITRQNEDKPAMTYLLPALKKTSTYSRTAYQPQDNDDYYEAYYACLNRNRDLNGNGTIDQDELRWFLPSRRMYVRMILGQNSLSSPLVVFPNDEEEKKLFYGTQWNGGPGDTYCSAHNGRYHYISSDLSFIWTEEGTSLSLWSVSGHQSQISGNTGNYWNLRCIRGLGVNMTTISTEDKSLVDKAYEYAFYDAAGNEVETNQNLGGVFKMTYYEQTNNRDMVAEALPVHKVNSPVNRTPMKFEFYKENIPVTVYSCEEWWNTLRSSNPCSQLDKTTGRTGWRVPNQQELMCLVMLQNNENVNIGVVGEMICGTQELFLDRDGTGGTGFACVGYQSEFFLQMKRANVFTGSGILHYIRCVRDVIDR